jgi:maleylpyruvate isomerase
VRPDDVIEAVTDAQRRLVDQVDGLDDDQVAAPSGLPGWTRGHVITHLARNADSHTWMFEGAAMDEVRPQYPRPAMRADDIAAGAGRGADEQADDLRQACRRLEQAWDDLPDQGWDRLGVVGPGPRPMRDILFRRWREVEVHHVDLAVGYRPADWPADYVAGELARGLPGLAERAGPEALVAWLLGRASAPELAPWQATERPAGT